MKLFTLFERPTFTYGGPPLCWQADEGQAAIERRSENTQIYFSDSVCVGASLTQANTQVGDALGETLLQVLAIFGFISATIRGRRRYLALRLAPTILSMVVFNQAEAVGPSDFGSRVTPEAVTALFPKRAKNNVLANWPLVQIELKNFGLSGSKHMVIYALATIRVETGTFSPAAEAPSKHSRTVDRPGYAEIKAPGKERPFGAYDSSLRARKDGTPVVNKSLGNCYYRGIDEELMRARHGMPPLPKCDDGVVFRGRGFIQLTGRYNYEQMQKQIGNKASVDLVMRPDDAGVPAVAARILAAYLSERREVIEGHMRAARYEEARKVVNTAGLGLSDFTQFVKAAEKAFGD